MLWNSRQGEENILHQVKFVSVVLLSALGHTNTDHKQNSEQRSEI